MKKRSSSRENAYLHGEMYRFVIFDFDGTLVDTNVGIVLTYVRALNMLGYPCPPEPEITATIGLPLKESFQKMVDGLSDEEADEAVILYRNIFDETALPVIKSFPHIGEELGAIREHGIRMAVATSRGRRSLNLIAERMGIARYFDGLYAVEDVVNHKPSPDLALLAMERHGFNPDETLVVGDATYDLLMGHNAGCNVCGVTWGNQSVEQLKTADPEYLIDDIRKLSAILGIL